MMVKKPTVFKAALADEFVQRSSPSPISAPAVAQTVIYMNQLLSHFNSICTHTYLATNRVSTPGVSEQARATAYSPMPVPNKDKREGTKMGETRARTRGTEECRGYILVTVTL